ncbi:transglutaminase family protein [Solirubrobacter soli]|uniref:transglutaminase family protein n=1 Tax=Solirubrobacter soli TaxID=363832 RepID=UPI0004261FDD|nr:transglutaminase family protein [Solirubrobacter soli]
MSSSDRDTAVRRPVTALPFRLHASVTCPPPAELALSLAWELGDFDADRSERNLTALAAAILPGTERDPAAQLRALGEAVTNMVLCSRSDGGPNELLIDQALEHGHAHPVLVAIVLQEIGRRAGIPVGIVANENGHFLAHQRLTDARVLDPRTGRLVDADALGVLRWQCGHQVAAELLDLLQPRYERNGDLTRALHVARLRTTLPFEDMAEAEQRLRRITSRLN